MVSVSIVGICVSETDINLNSLWRSSFTIRFWEENIISILGRSGKKENTINGNSNNGIGVW
jgi:hypothetical protein